MEKLKKAREELTDATDKYISAVDKATETEKKLQEAQEQTGINIDDLLAKMSEENLSYQDLNDKQKEVYKAYMDNKSAQDQLKTSTDEFNQKQDEQYQKLAITIGQLMSTSTSYDDYRDRVVRAMREGSMSTEDAVTAIMVAMGKMDDKTKKTFEETLPDDIKAALNTGKYTSYANTFKNWWNNSFLGSLKTKLTFTPGVNLGGVVNALSKLGTMKFATGGLVTKMATGGLINLPGRGVPLSSAIGGEAGREGIVPLTDTQAMAELGREIGRWIQVNTTVVNNMNGRQISREIHKLENEQDFAFNN